MTSLRLYSRPDCHLCEEAADLILSHDQRIQIEEVNIEDDLGHLAQYGVRIPVLQRKDNGKELPWPFGQDELVRFLA